MVRSLADRTFQLRYWTKIGIAVYRVRFDTRLNEQSQRVNLSEAFDGLELVAREVTDWLT